MRNREILRDLKNEINNLKMIDDRHTVVQVPNARGDKESRDQKINHRKKTVEWPSDPKQGPNVFGTRKFVEKIPEKIAPSHL
jgi:hypothetical protein